MENKLSASRSLFMEFFRYVIVGGISFIADFAFLVIFKEVVLKSFPYSLYIASLMGFLAGSAVNYILSVRFVFLSAKKAGLGKGTKDRIVFILIGAAGLLINEAGMYIGSDVLGIYYMFVKVFVVGAVMVWNYAARKLLVFNTGTVINSETEKDGGER
jgi:putative flippase GtrA